MSHVGYEDDKGWKENKKKVMYVVPKLSNKKQNGDVDKMYSGCHLIKDNHGMHKKFANVTFGYFLKFIAFRKSKQEMNSR